MAWNKNLPDGDLDAAQLDDDVRTNNTAIEDAVDEEHYFATGGGQHGRHKIPNGTTATRNGLANVVDGMFYFNTDALSGYTVLQVRLSGNWVDIGVLDAQIFRMNTKGRATVPQFGDWLEVAIAANAIAIDFDTSPRKWTTLTQNVTISNPTNDTLAGTSGSEIILELIQDGTGGWTVSWGNNYRTIDGLTPAISTTAGSRTRVYISSTKEGKYLVSTAPNMAVIS